jgi:hypothetical protein
MVDKPDRDHDPANDNGGVNDNRKAVVPTPAVPAVPAIGAIATLSDLHNALAKVDTAVVAGRSTRPMMQYKSREQVFTFGQKATVVEEGTRWVINPMSLKWGQICFDRGSDKKPTEQIVSVALLKPDVTKLPDLGAPWQGNGALT